MKRLFAAAVFFLSLAAGAAQAQSLTATPASLYASQAVTGAWSGIAAPTNTDWVGLYAVGSADSAFVAWQYTNGSASGSAPITVPNSTAPGSYELRLFANNGYTRLATSNGITVQTPPPANLSAAPASLYASQTVTGSYSSIFSPTATDWVGLYAVGAADTSFIAWQYTNGSASGSTPIVVPNTTAPGSYELRLFSNNGYTKLATSSSFAVQSPPSANLSASPASLYASQTVTGTYSSIFSPTATDWVGLYAVGAADNAFLAWQYTNGSAAGSVPIVLPNATAAGSYELRLFSNNGYTKLATSNAFTVQSPPAATLSATPGSVAPGGSVTAAWTSILAPTATDWIGLYAAGAADNAFISWKFTTGTAAGSVPFAIGASLPLGTYELRLFANNGYTKLATSGPLTVGNATATLSFIHTDHLNTPRLITNQAQQAVWRWDQQEPFGASPVDENPGGQGVFEYPGRFPGQYSDKETNLSNNYFRDYDPSAGRYSQSDPIGLRGGLNTYAYVGAAPIMLRDPLGLRPPPTGWQRLHEQLLEYGIELGILSPAKWMKVGDSCGEKICGSGGALSSRSLNLIDTISGFCIEGLSAGQMDFAIEAKTNCEERCEKYIKKVCPGNMSSCPFLNGGSL